MPRQGRLHVPGGYYHVMGRGLERRYIFAGDEDKADFLERLGDGLFRTGCDCLAFAMMSNHYHLLIRVSSAPLSELMSRVLSGYATHYNKRKRRSGYVFQNRYKSILCDADDYLLGLIRYIHLNPIKARMLASLAELDSYPWTGHSGLVGTYVQPWYRRDEVLKLFSLQRNSALKSYQAFMRDGLSYKDKQDYSGGGLVRSHGGWEAVTFLRQEHASRIGDERILGDTAFVEACLKTDDLALSPKTYWKDKGWDLTKLVQRVCKYTDIDVCDLKKKGRDNNISLSKNLVCYWGTQILGIPAIEIAVYLNMSQPAVSKAKSRGADYCKEHDLKWINLVEKV